MSNFPRVRAPGFWTSLSTLASSEIEIFDAHQSKTINAEEGSSHAPTTQIVLGGQGLRVSGNLVADALIVNSGKTSTWNSGSIINSSARLNFLGVWVGDWSSGSVIGLDAGATLNVSGIVAFHASSQLTTTATAITIGTGSIGITGTTIVMANVTSSRDAASTETDAATILRAGPTTQSGNDAVRYERHAAVPLGTGVSVDSTNDTWRIQDDTVNTQTITVLAPPNALPFPIEIYLSQSGNTFTANIVQPDGTTLIGLIGGTLRWTDSAGGTGNKSGSVRLEYNAALSKYRIKSCHGTFVPGPTAV